MENVVHFLLSWKWLWKTLYGDRTVWDAESSTWWYDHAKNTSFQVV